MLDFVQSKEFQEQLVPVTDALFERYKLKLFSSLGGSMKGVNAEVGGGGFNPLDLMGKGGKPNWLGLIASFMGGQKKNESSSSLP